MKDETFHETLMQTKVDKSRFAFYRQTAKPIYHFQTFSLLKLLYYWSYQLIDCLRAVK
jgi:hypothetical protein